MDHRPRGSSRSLWAGSVKAGPNWAGLRGELRRQRAPQPVLRPAGLVMEADVIGSCGGHGAQRKLCGQRGLSSRRRTKRPGPGSAPRRRGGGKGWGRGLGTPPPHTCQSPRGPGGPECWQEIRGCSRPIGRRSTPPSPRPRPSSRAFTATPSSRAEGRQIKRTGSCAQPRISAFLQRSDLDPAKPKIYGQLPMPPSSDAGPSGSWHRRWFLPSLLRGEPYTEGPLRGWHCLPDAHSAFLLGGPCRILARIPLYPAWQWCWAGSWQAGLPWMQTVRPPPALGLSTPALILRA